MRQLLILTLLVLSACAPASKQLTNNSSQFENYICPIEIQQDLTKSLSFCIQYQATEAYCTRQILELYCERK